MPPTIRADLRPQSGQDMLRNPPGPPAQAEFLPLLGDPGPPQPLQGGAPAVPGASSVSLDPVRSLSSELNAPCVEVAAGRSSRVRKPPLRFSPSSAGRPRKKTRALSPEEAALHQAVSEPTADPGAAEDPVAEAADTADSGAEMDNETEPEERKAVQAPASCGGIPRLGCPFCTKSWANRAGLLHHVEACHLSTGQTPPEQFLLDAARRICQRCLIFAPEAGPCRKCHCFGESTPQTEGPTLPDVPCDLGSALRHLQPFAPTQRLLPKQALDEIAKLLTDLLNRATSCRSVQTVASLLLMPRFVLAPLARGGRRHEAQTTRILLDRVAKWRAGIWQSQALEDPPRRKTKKPKQTGLPEATERAVVNAIKDKALSKACRILSTSHLPPVKDAEAKLRELHPPGPLPTLAMFGGSVAPGNFDFDVQLVKGAISSFAGESGAGPSGLRPRHLRELAKAKRHGQALLEALAGFSSAMANGHFGQECMQLFTAARLVPLPKKGDGVRPIAVGDTLRRLVAKCVLEGMIEEIVRFLVPLQVGVQVANAAELLARRVRLWAKHAPPGSALLQLDLKNAFNSVLRTTMLSSVQQFAPALLPFAFACYHHPTCLFGDGFTLQSTRGVQQGDVLGPALFALAIHPIVLKLEATALDVQAWYLDDGDLCGKLEELQKAYDLAKVEFQKIGLTVNAEKSKLFLPNNDEVPLETFVGVPRIPASSGVEVLGVPIGSESFVAKTLARKLEELEFLLSRLALLESSLAKFLLLRACLGACRVVFLLRTVPFGLGKQLAEKSAALVRHSLEALLQMPLDDVQFGLACLRTHKGGLGIQDPRQVHGPAFLGSNFTYAASATSGLPRLFWEELEAGWKEVRSMWSLPGELLSALVVPVDDAEPELEEDWSRQRWWQSLVEQKVEQHWLAVASVRQKVIKELGEARFCFDVSGLLGCQEGDSPLSSRAWALGARYRLGAPMDTETTRLCPGCGCGMDPLGDHALSCHSLGTYGRHNDLRNKFAALCQDAGLRVQVEDGPEGSSRRVGDTVVHGLFEVPAAVDFVLPHALHPSCDLANVRAGKAAALAERRKRRDNGPECVRGGWRCMPFAAETFGAWGAGARFLVQRLVRHWSQTQDCSLREAGLLCHGTLGAAVLKAVCRQLERGFPVADGEAVGGGGPAGPGGGPGGSLAF